MESFLYHYIRSMRLYYGFVTMTTALLGVAFARTQLGDASFIFGKTIIVLAIAFLAWGVNQIFSDYFDRKEDAINAPHRPMVTGALKPKPALTLSAVLMLLIGVSSFMLSPYAFLFLVIGGLLNIAYSCLKRVPVLNCIVYACAISCCFPFAYAGVADKVPDVFTSIIILLFVFPAHFLMCHNSYFKDVKGDEAAGVRTLQTLFSPVVARYVSWIVGGLFLLLHYIIVFGITFFEEDPLSDAHRQLIILLYFQLGLEAILFAFFMHEIKHQRFHNATRLNCQWCVSMMYMLMMYMLLMPYPIQWLFPVLEILSLLAIQLLFRWYRDEKE